MERTGWVELDRTAHEWAAADAAGRSAGALSGRGENPSRDFRRVPKTALPLPEMMEVFDIGAAEEGEGELIRLRWDRTELVVPVRVR